MKKFLVLAAAVSALSVSAFGASITYNGSFGTAPNGLTTAFTAATPLSAFDPSFGNLTSITFSITGTTTGSGSLTNNSGSAATYDVSLSTTLSLRTPANVILVQVVPVYENPALSVGSGATATFSGTSSTLTNTVVLTSGFAPYVGPSGAPGTIAFNVRGTGASSVLDGPTPYTFSPTTSGFGVDSVTYTYTPTSGTPEPATMGLLGSALIGLGFLKFRTKKS